MPFAPTPKQSFCVHPSTSGGKVGGGSGSGTYSNGHGNGGNGKGGGAGGTNGAGLRTSVGNSFSFQTGNAGTVDNKNSPANGVS